jgi:SAM-dependent methyltransferase
MTLPETVSQNLERHDLLASDEQALYVMQLEKIDRIASLLARFARPRTTSLADVGAFTGWATERYAAASQAKHVVCFDLSGAALQRCAERGFDTARWNCEEPSPAADQAFSVVVAADIVEHLVNTDLFMAELHRTLLPGGILIVSTPNLAYWCNRLRLMAGRTPWSYPGVSSTFRRSPTVDLSHIRINVPTEWTPFFEARGFTVLERTGYSIFKTWTTTAWGRLRARLDELADVHAPDLAFGNIYVLQRSL